MAEQIGQSRRPQNFWVLLARLLHGTLKRSTWLAHDFFTVEESDGGADIDIGQGGEEVSSPIMLRNPFYAHDG